MNPPKTKGIVTFYSQDNNRDDFLKQFLDNLKDELESIGNNKFVKNIVENPYESQYEFGICNIEILYLYLLALDDEKYNNILKKILDEICEIEKKEDVENQNVMGVEKQKSLCQTYEQEIEKLKEINRQRKEKIKELEIGYNILNEENRKLKLDNGKLRLDNEKLTKIIQESRKMIESGEIKQRQENDRTKCKRQEPVLAVIKKSETDKFTFKCDVDEILVDCFLDMKDVDVEFYRVVLVYKKNISISKLRKIKKTLGEKAILCEEKEEVYNYIEMMEENNENGSN